MVTQLYLITLVLNILNDLVHAVFKVLNVFSWLYFDEMILISCLVPSMNGKTRWKIPICIVFNCWEIWKHILDWLAFIILKPIIFVMKLYIINSADLINEIISLPVCNFKFFSFINIINRWISITVFSNATLSLFVTDIWEWLKDQLLLSITIWKLFLSDISKIVWMKPNWLHRVFTLDSKLITFYLSILIDDLIWYIWWLDLAIIVDV